MDKIDPLYYARSSRINLTDETRIKATSEEAFVWEKAHQDVKGSLQRTFHLTGLMMRFSPTAEFHFQHILPNCRYESLRLCQNHSNIHKPCKTLGRYPTPS